MSVATVEFGMNETRFEHCFMTLFSWPALAKPSLMTSCNVCAKQACLSILKPSKLEVLIDSKLSFLHCSDHQCPPLHILVVSLVWMPLYWNLVSNDVLNFLTNTKIRNYFVIPKLDVFGSISTLNSVAPNNSVFQFQLPIPKYECIWQLLQRSTVRLKVVTVVRCSIITTAFSLLH